MTFSTETVAAMVVALVAWAFLVVERLRRRKLLNAWTAEHEAHTKTLCEARNTDRSRLAERIVLTRQLEAIRTVAEIRGNLIERLRAAAAKAESDLREQVRELTELRAALAKAPIDLEALMRLEPGPLPQTMLKRRATAPKRRWKARKR